MGYITEMNISKIDLNLLVVFTVLMRERSVTRAAKSLFLTQSAVSASLKKLRVLLQDELFVRTSHGIAPTVKAVRIAPVIKEAINSISSVLDETAVDESYRAKEGDVFKIGLSDELECLMIKKLLAVSADLPISFAFYPTNSHFWHKALHDEGLDLVIVSNPKNMSSQHQSHVLFASSYSCVFDNHIHRLTHKITFEEYVNKLHGRVVFDGGRAGFLDEYFEAEGYKRQVKATFFNYSTAVNAIIGSPLLLTMPTYAAHTYAENNVKLAVHPVPLILAPSFVVGAIWDIKKQTDLRNLWLRDLVVNVTAETRTNLRSNQ